MMDMDRQITITGSSEAVRYNFFKQGNIKDLIRKFFTLLQNLLENLL